MMLFKILLAALLCLAHGQVLKAPLASLSPSPSPPPPRPPGRNTPSPTPNMKYSMAPTSGVGKFLGRCGQETPAFRKRCRKCCWQTKKTWKHAINFLRRCDRCKLKANLNPGGNCPYGAFLGWSGNPTKCFYERCNKMLVAKGPCMCF